MVYGEGLPGGVYVPSTGQFFDYFSGALDVVAHELTHGVTDYSSHLEYVNESGALNEAFSDMMGTSVEFFFQPPGTGLLKADYLIGEDIARAAVSGALDGFRSMANPALFDQPDHYSKRVLLPPDEDHDNGGVHINSGIPNHAFYLAIEGGTNRTSGIRVQGVGASNREQIEKVFYRGFTQLMPVQRQFLDGASHHAARGAGSLRAEQRAVQRRPRRLDRRGGELMRVVAAIGVWLASGRSGRRDGTRAERCGRAPATQDRRDPHPSQRQRRRAAVLDLVHELDDQTDLPGERHGQHHI